MKEVCVSLNLESHEKRTSQQNLKMQMSIEAGFTMHEFLSRHGKCVCVGCNTAWQGHAFCAWGNCTCMWTTISFHGLCFLIKWISMIALFLDEVNKYDC